MERIIIILKYLYVIQEKEFTDPFNRVNKKTRVNPYHPLSYILLFVIIIVGIFLYGFFGAWKELDLKEVFRWTRI